MWDLPFEEGSVEEVYSSHALEHVAMGQVQQTLREWHRVLISGGRATIRVPDLAWCLSAWLANPTMDFEMMRIFGNQAHEGEFHKCGFTGELLARALSAAGFHVTHIGTIWSHGQQTLDVQAYKP
jgi:predicted SAM-dependent methyltransferase